MSESAKAVSVGFAWALSPMPALAEVMDKEFSLGQIWIFTALFPGLGLWLMRWKAWVPLFILPITASFAYLNWEELFDPYIKSAILTEAGWSYIIQIHVAATINLTAPIALIIWRTSLKSNLR
jgi:hypothetical protein